MSGDKGHPEIREFNESYNFAKDPLAAASASCSNGTRRRRLVTLLAAFALVSFGLQHFARLPVTPFNYNLHNIANDPRLEPYQSIGSAEYCAEWPTSTDSQASTVSFDLLKGADLLFFLSRGPVAGHLNMIRRTNYSEPGVPAHIRVEVTTEERDRKLTKVCRVGNDARNERGILIWAEPRHPHNEQKEHASVNITIAIPLNLRAHKDITTDLPMFSHRFSGFGDWWSPTAFGTLRFKASNAPILYDSLIGDSAFIQTSNAEVEGEFTGKNKLAVQTSNSHITSWAWMSGEGSGSEINLRTSHG
ncbi:hypothetical protein B0H10DRAFT_1962354 [Mycena sp. CBHHK59/15]|nr:hypothetical protein B0H10DRAFT_1962354 [Mycena sp. CBHHK59/15]